METIDINIENIDIIKHFIIHDASKMYCVLGVLKNTLGQKIEKEMLLWLTEKYDVISVELDFPGKLFEYPAILYALKLAILTNENVLYCHTKGSFNASYYQYHIRTLWKDEFINHYDEYVNILSEPNTVACPFTGKAKWTWFNGFYISPSVANNFTLLKTSNRYYYETIFERERKIKVVGRIYSDIDNYSDSNNPTKLKLRLYLIDNYVKYSNDSKEYYLNKNLCPIKHMYKIIVSMASYPGRIKNVVTSIKLLLNKQTVKPDEIHLWLSIEEFPNKELDLPNDLTEALNDYRCYLHWLEKNTYVHKRHEIFKYTNDNDLVFLIDDDVEYNSTLIETIVKLSEKYPNTIINYNIYPTHEYRGRRIIYIEHPELGQGPFVNKIRWCGLSMIPAKVYPKEILDDEHLKIRNECSKVSDECWFLPWIVYYDIPVYYCKFGWGKDIDPKNGMNKGICSWSHLKEANGYERRDNWLYATLTAYPELYKKYQDLFNYGK